MYKKLFLLVVFGLSCMVSTNAYSLAVTQISTDGPCECETVLNPTFQLVEFDEQNCTATFYGSPGDSACLDDYYLQYYWFRDGEWVSSGTNQSITFLNVADLGFVDMKVVASISQSGFELCQRTAGGIAYSDYTCNTSVGGDILVSKQAFNRNTEVATCNVYSTTPFDWRITIENTFPNDVSFFFFDQFPQTPMGLCDFTIIDMSIEYPGTIPVEQDPVFTSGSITLPPGITIINYAVAPSGGGCSTVGSIPNDDPLACENITDDCGCQAPYWNRFAYVFQSGPNKGSGDVCNAVCLRYGCPAALKDGKCLESNEIEAGDVLESELAFHATFLNVVKMEADIIFDGEKVSNIQVELNNAIPNSFATTINITGDNSAHLIIETSNNADAIDIQSGLYTPLKLKGTLIDDLTDCFSFQLANFVMTSYSGTGFETSPLYVDPGEFCEYYDDDYESAWITTPNGELCASSDNVLTLSAIGPFESQHPSVQYLWSTGATTQTIDVSTGGVYSVDIVDENGCDRVASITLDTCPNSSCEECGDLNPQIVLNLIGCQVKANIIQNDCLLFANETYYWEFSNGNTYLGLNPPLQSNSPNGGVLSAKVTVSYYIPDVGFCSETDKDEIFIPCRSDKKYAALDMKMYPNPVKDILTVFIDNAESQKGNIEILNSMGLTMFKLQHDASISKKSEIDVSILSPGIYFVSYTNEKEEAIIKQLIIN